jgi:hypothetical protein
MKSKKSKTARKPGNPKTASRKPARRARPGPRTLSAPEDLHRRIAMRAYEFYERRIRQGPLDDWLEAEQEILGQKKTRDIDMPHRGGYAAPEQD